MIIDKVCLSVTENLLIQHSRNRARPRRDLSSKRSRPETSFALRNLFERIFLLQLGQKLFLDGGHLRRLRHFRLGLLRTDFRFPSLGFLQRGKPRCSHRKWDFVLGLLLDFGDNFGRFQRTCVFRNFVRKILALFCFART